MMPKSVTCQWVACTHNTSQVPDSTGECLFDGTLELTVPDPYNDEGLNCRQYENEPHKFDEFYKSKFGFGSVG
jgi:hypothetical protein